MPARVRPEAPERPETPSPTNESRGSSSPIGRGGAIASSIGAAINDGLEKVGDAMEAVDQTVDAGTRVLKRSATAALQTAGDAMEATADAMEATNDAVVAPTRRMLTRTATGVLEAAETAMESEDDAVKKRKAKQVNKPMLAKKQMSVGSGLRALTQGLGDISSAVGFAMNMSSSNANDDGDPLTHTFELTDIPFHDQMISATVDTGILYPAGQHYIKWESIRYTSMTGREMTLEAGNCNIYKYPQACPEGHSDIDA